jgi:hypothetical protein
MTLDIRRKEDSNTVQIFNDQKTTASIPAIIEEWSLDWQIEYKTTRFSAKEQQQVSKEREFESELPQRRPRGG